MSGHSFVVQTEPAFLKRKDLPTEFGPNKNVVWKTALPPGHSSPVLTRDRIFVTAHDKDTLLVICLDRQTGKILWQREVPRSMTGRLAERQWTCFAESGY